ncbi:hypothetical protein CEXT_62441, partial [Caerostris extrusa]
HKLFIFAVVVLVFVEVSERALVKVGHL